MPSIRTPNPREIEKRSFAPIVFSGGIDKEISRYSAPPGTLFDAVNYEASSKGLTRGQGLLHYDGTVDTAVSDMWVIAATDAESSVIGSGFTLGGRATWGTDGAYGTVVYWKRVSAATSYTYLGLIEVEGALPTDGDTVTDEETGTLYVLSGPLTYQAASLATAVNPSTGALLAPTTTDYLALLNNEVNNALVASTVVTGSGLSAYYHGKMPGVGGVTGGWQLDDTVYGVRDAYAIAFAYGDTEVFPGETVTIDTDDGNEVATVLAAVLTAGLWDGTGQGYLVLGPSSSTVDYRYLANPTASSVITSSSGDVGVAFGLADVSGGLVWKATTHGWQWVNTGWTLSYDTGTNAPNVVAAPLFLPDLVDSQRDTGFDLVSAGATGTGPDYDAWTNASNITADDASYATCSLSSGRITHELTATVGANSIPHDNVRVVGVEVQVEALYTGSNAPIDRSARLFLDDGTSYLRSVSRARREVVTSSAVVYTYGGSTDLWGLDEISAELINSGDFKFKIQYENTSAGSGQIEVDFIKVKFYYVPNNEKVWVRDTAASADVSTADIHAVQVMSGDFGSGNDAEGYLSLSNVTSPESIGVGMSLYTESAAGGLLVAKVSSVPEYNLLPGEADMLANNSKWQNIRANFYENDESEAIYAVNGAGPAITFDGTNFARIYTPLIRAVDKPRSLAFHTNRLALGFGYGSVVQSVVGTPNDFSAVDGSVAWGVGDAVTGLISLPGSVLGVFSESSIRTLEGSSEADGLMRTVVSNSGAKEYTVQNIIGPYYADNRGISNLETSDRFGDFAISRLSDPVRTWLRDRIQQVRSLGVLDTKPIASVPVRNKSQYRLYFADGYYLTMYFRPDGVAETTFGHYDTETFSTAYVPTFIDSSVLSTGRERIIMGTSDGSLWIVDGANVLQTPEGPVTPDAWIVTNPIDFGTPEGLHKVQFVTLQGLFYGAQTIDSWSDSNYVFEATGNAHYTTAVGEYSSPPEFTERSLLESFYLPTLTDGVSFKFQTTLDGSRPHSLQALLIRATRAGTDRNAAPRAY